MFGSIMTDEWVLPRVATTNDPLRLAIFFSGSGSGMAALLDHQKNRTCSHQTVVAVTDKSNADGILKAEQRGIPVEIIPLPTKDSPKENRKRHENLIQEAIDKYQIETIILSGYMRILTDNFVKKWRGRLLNIHPSLLPNYPGAHAHRDALADGAKESGCTVHFVDTEVDAGPIIGQEKLPVYVDDDIESLSNRVKKAEHILYPAVIDALASGKITID